MGKLSLTVLATQPQRGAILQPGATPWAKLFRAFRANKNKEKPLFGGYASLNPPYALWGMQL
ncbi:MAG: hypothetical protein AAB069_05435, partial [Planctomycetota bacterium]